jgi:hypothetical protein
MTRPIPQVIARLKADSSVNTLTSGRIFADNPPQDDDLPFVVLTIVNTIARPTVNNCQVKQYASRMQIDIICETRGKAEQIQEAIEDSLGEYSSTDATHPIQGITVDSGTSWQILEPSDGSDQRGYWCSQEYFINYSRG